MPVLLEMVVAGVLGPLVVRWARKGCGVLVPQVAVGMGREAPLRGTHGFNPQGRIWGMVYACHIER